MRCAPGATAGSDLQKNKKRLPEKSKKSPQDLAERITYTRLLQCNVILNQTFCDRMRM